MAIGYKQLAHVALRCKDYPAMYDFYVDKLGGQELFHLNWSCLPQGKGDESVWLTYIKFGRDNFIELFNADYQGGNAHGAQAFCCLCLEVGNMVMALTSLSDMGIPIHKSPEGPLMTAPFSQYGPDEEGSLRAYTYDPEGNWIELQQFTARSFEIRWDEARR